MGKERACYAKSSPKEMKLVSHSSHAHKQYYFRPSLSSFNCHSLLTADHHLYYKYYHARGGRCVNSGGGRGRVPRHISFYQGVQILSESTKKQRLSPQQQTETIKSHSSLAPFTRTKLVNFTDLLQKSSLVSLCLSHFIFTLS